MKRFKKVMWFFVACSGCVSANKTAESSFVFECDKTSSSPFAVVTGLDQFVKGKVNIRIDGINNDDVLPLSPCTKICLSVVNMSEDDILFMTNPNILRVNWTEITTDKQTFKIKNPIVLPADSHILHEGVFLRHAGNVFSYNSHMFYVQAPSVLEAFTNFIPPPDEFDLSFTFPETNDVKYGKIEFLFTLKYMKNGSFEIHRENLKKTISVIYDPHYLRELIREN